MKYCVIIPDGMADEPIDVFGNKTPLEGAFTPHMDYFASIGMCGLTNNIPEGMSPGSDVAILSIMGYNPQNFYTGRAPLEAAAKGIILEDNEVAFRCNFVTVADGIMMDYSAGSISDKEAQKLIELLNSHFQQRGIRFYSGVGYRNLMIIKGLNFDDLFTTPPHDISGKPIEPYLPQGKNSEFIIDIMQESYKLLKDADINQVRIDLGENPANMIWLWGQGKRPFLKSFKEIFKLEGAVVSAVDLVRGIAKTIGMQVLEVSGATGYIDTNYEGKGKALIEGLKEYDIVFVHIEAPDEASHNGDALLKIKAIEYIDKYIVGECKKLFETFSDEMRVLILPDHATPVRTKTHTHGYVPFVMAGKNIKHTLGCDKFCESTAKQTGIVYQEGYTLLKDFIL